ncbi:hypothetical protein [Catenovulum adriaticum]|uniref:Stealth family protein n=1 Tax=Catenovulum adriaticum TaxID=2984846 RepID=A0ABY7ANA3_9ALTE|nr:hypothetical protein [Catenovulum sp. TS8]WAJ71047.1 stealth family protein [Catenovulum sp. TS8]
MYKNIDFVILWVDGNCTAHKAKRERYLADFKIDVKHQEQSTSSLRFVQHDELKFCLRSIKRFAPWYNKIYLITDEQIPTFLDASKLHLDRIEIIDHKELFSESPQYLPTFNSRVITTQLHKLAKLSDYFIYGNDDFILGSKIEPDFFFVDNQPMLYVEEHGMMEQERVTLHQQGVINGAEMIGYSKSKFFPISHGFVPLDKARIKHLERQFPTEFQNNLKHKFRHESQFLLESLYIHYCIKNQEGILKSTEPMVHFSFELCRIGQPEKIKFLFNLIKKGQRKMFCLNEFQSLWPRIPFVKDFLEDNCGPPMISETQ